MKDDSGPTSSLFTATKSLTTPNVQFAADLDTINGTLRTDPSTGIQKPFPAMLPVDFDIRATSPCLRG